MLGGVGGWSCKGTEDLNPKLKPKIKPKPRPAATVSTGLSQALENLCNVNNAVECEDQVQHELKDVVDRCGRAGKR